MTERLKKTGSTLWDMFSGPNGPRTIIIILVASMHPIGRSVLATFGFEFPDQKKLTVAADQAIVAQRQNNDLASEMSTLKTDMTKLVVKVDTMGEKVESLSQRFGVFQIDFDKYRKEPK